MIGRPWFLRSKDLMVGDICRLKSGGPLMTCIDISPAGEVMCLWVTDDRFRMDRFDTRRFPLAALKRVWWDR